MTPPVPLDFIVAGGSEIGLGHIMRSAALSEAALRRGHGVRVYLSADEGARAAWEMAAPNMPLCRVLSWSDYPALLRTDRHTLRAPVAPLAFLDFPSEKNAWIQRIHRSGARALVIDDPRTVHLADCTLLPALHHGLDRPGASPASPHGPRTENREVKGAGLRLEGPAYSILAETHRQIPLRPWASRSELLLSIGGADPHRATPRLAAWLTKVLDEPGAESGACSAFKAKHAVLGAAYHDPDDATRKLLEDAGWKVHRSLPPEQMAERMASARLAVTGFGTSLTELAWHGTPHLSVTHHRFDIAHATRLERHGVGRHLGYAGELDVEKVMKPLTASLLDVDWQESSSQLAREMLRGGHGTDRILAESSRLAAQPRLSDSEKENPSELPNAAPVV